MMSWRRDLVRQIATGNSPSPALQTRNQGFSTASRPACRRDTMTLRARLIFVAVIVLVFSAAIAFRMAIEGVPLKVFTAMCGAWLIAKVHQLLRTT